MQYDFQSYKLFSVTTEYKKNSDAIVIGGITQCTVVGVLLVQWLKQRTVES